uniref:Right handed beta helix domain-containing protein n=1 Tax=Acetithermum autotrophicum TaxID=1446466 RepID=H5SVQ0_ACEAU|nr:hypothetical protein HGMM_OP4C315 [Candidatus Acetothermum autotrophicum]
MSLVRFLGIGIATIGLLLGVPPGGAGSAQAECTVTVEPGQSIQKALDEAGENAIICLGAGTWEEALTISKGLTLRGQGVETTVIQRAPVQISADKEIAMTITDLAVVNSPEDGIAVRGPVRLTVRRVQLSSSQECGLDARKFARVHMSHSQVLDNGCGILAQESALLTVEESVISKNRRSGILLDFLGSSAQLRLTGSLVSENGENGLELWGPTVVLITGSTISRNGHVGIYSRDATLTVEKTLIAENRGGGFFVRDGRLMLKASQVSTNYDDGVLLRDNAHLQITDSQVVSNDGWGIAAMLKQCGWDKDLFTGLVAVSASTTITGNTAGELCLSPEPSVHPPPAPACHITLTPDQIPQAQQLIDDVLEETVICLPAGEFAITLTIAQSLTVRGSAEGRTILRAANPEKPVIAVLSPQPISVNLADLTLTGTHRESSCWPGQCRITLSAAGAAHVQLQRVSVVLSEQGISVTENAHVEIITSRLVENAYGVLISGSAHVAVRDSQIAYGEMGIMVGYYSGLVQSGLSEVHLERTRILGMRGCALLAWPEARLSGHENEFLENGVDLCGPVPSELRRPVVPQTERTELVVPRDYPTLQAALDAIAPGGTIFLERGLFSGATVYKDVRIRGAGEDQTRIHGALTVCCQAGRVSFTDFSLEGEFEQSGLVKGVFGDSGLWIFSGRFSDVELERVRIQRGGIGLMIGGIARVQGRNLTVTNNDMGLSVFGLSIVELRDSELSHNTAIGLGVGGNATLILRNTVIAGHENWGARIGGDSQVYLFESVVRDNQAIGIWAEGGAFVLLERTVVEHNDGFGQGGALIIKGQASSTVLESRVVGNGVGIRAQESSFLTVRRSVFAENSAALLAEGNATLWGVEESQFTENDDAIVLKEAVRVNALKGNEIRNNRGIGVQAEMPGNILECVGNVVEGNEGGNYNESAAEACVPQNF